MVAGTGRDRDRDSSEERPDYGGPEEPVAPGDIIGAEEPSGPSEPVGEEAARKAAEEEAARKAAEEEAASKAAEEAAAKAAEEEAAKKAAEETSREEPAEFVFGIVPPVGGPYPVSTDQAGSEYTYQEVRKVPKRRRASKEPKEPVPEPKEGPKKKPDKEKEPEEEPEEGGEKGKKGKGKNRNWRFRTEEGHQKRKLKSASKRAEKFKARGEELPEHLQQLLASFGPGGVSSSSTDRPRDTPKPEEEFEEVIEEPLEAAYKPRFVLKEAAQVRAETADVPEPDPGVKDQRTVQVGRLVGQIATPKPEPERSRSRPRDRRITVHPKISELAKARAHGEAEQERYLGSNYRQRVSAATEAVRRAKARGTVAQSIQKAVYNLDGIGEACSSCDDRVTKQKEVIREFAARRIAEKRAKRSAEDKPKEEGQRKEEKGTKEKKVQKFDSYVPVLVPGRQRGQSLEREVRRHTYEYRRRGTAEAADTGKEERSRSALRRAEANREVLPEEREEKKEEKKGEKKEEKEESKEEERTPWIIKAVERAEAAVAAERAESLRSTPTTPRLPKRRRRNQKKAKK